MKHFKNKILKENLSGKVILINSDSNEMERMETTFISSPISASPPPTSGKIFQ